LDDGAGTAWLSLGRGAWRRGCGWRVRVAEYHVYHPGSAQHNYSFQMTI